jgi:mercuric ion binding protein
MKTFKTLFLAALLAATSTVSAATIEMDVNGLVCAFCAQGIEKTLREFPATTDVYVSLENRIVAIELADGADIDDDTIRTAITEAGYTVVAIRRGDGTLQDIRDRVAAEADDE